MARRRFAHAGGRRWRVAGSIAAAALALALGGAPHRADARPAGDRPASGKSARAQPGPILAVVSLARQRIWVWGSEGLIAHSPVSTGMAGHRTPAGVFSVVQKSRFHRSNIYSNAPMPFMQRITWSGIALHAGVVPGYPASHGCIRLPHQFAVELWGMTRIGARVVIVPDDPSVFHIEHNRLPVPLLTPAPRYEVVPPVRLETASIVASDAGPGGADDDAPEPAVLLAPLERAKAARVRAVADAAAKARLAKAALAASAAKAAEASKAIAALRRTEHRLAAAIAARDAAAQAIGESLPPQKADRARARLEAAEAAVAELEKSVEEARGEEAARTPEALAAAKAAWEAEQADGEAAALLKATERNTEPVSIFVSRKAGRVYVRQAWAPIHEAPVAFDQPDEPVGTHLYLAAAPQDGQAALRWLAVSISNRPAPDAVGALARFQLPAATRRFIEDRLWTGASLIVSDEGISGETGSTTDFIVLTR
jgi:hypothetical protein